MKELEPHLSRLSNTLQANGVNKGAALAILPQTVYANLRGYKTMPDVIAVEGKPPRERPKLVDENKVGQEKAEELERKAEEAVIQAVSEIQKQKATPLRARTKKEDQPQEGEKKVKPIKEYFPETPTSPAIAQAVEAFRHDAAGWTLEELANYNTGFLMRQYLTLRSLAHNLEAEQGFLSEIKGALEKKGIRTDSLYTRMRREGMLAEGGMTGGATPLNATEFADTTARNVVLEINDEIERAGENTPLPADFIVEQTQRVRNLVDEGRVDADEGRRILRSLGGWREETREVQEQEQGEGGGRRGRMTPEEQAERARRNFLTAEEAGEFNIAVYTDSVIEPIAQEVRQRIEDHAANNDYFKEKIDQLVAIRANPTYTDNAELRKQAGLLQGEVQSLKDTLSAKAVTEEARMEQSLYGELRLNSQETKDLVELVLKAGNQREGETPEERAIREEADREIDRRFNRLFARADINTNDDWRDALGSAGSLELDNFEMALGYAGTGRSLPQGQRLTPDQKVFLEKKIRQLNESKKLREYLHSMSYYVNRNFTIEDIAKVVQNFTGEQADLAYREKGVATVSRLYEQAMFQIIAKRGGYLPYESMINKRDGTSGEVEQLVRDHIEVAKQMGELPADMEDWEINRAISYSRGMGIVSARFMEIVALAGVSQKAPLVSWWANDVIKKIAFFKQVARYNIGYEANKLLGFKMEGSAPIWSIKELTEIGDIGNEVAFGLTEKENDDRYISVVNPFRIGSIYTQTRWRYTEDDLNHGGVIAALLDGYKNNPLIGAGMWIEKERMSMHSTKKLTDDQRAELRAELGADAATEGERAALRIRKNVELASKITPLKAFYNLPWFQRSVIERYYMSRLPRDYQTMNTEDKLDARRNLITEMNDDLTALTIVQEKLLHERTGAYKTAMEDLTRRKEEWERGGRQGPEPKNLNLNLYEQHTNLFFDDVPAERRQRVKDLADHIRDEFLKDQHKNRLINELKNKGWKVPFVFGTEDIPVELYDWTASGGSTYKRRWQSDIGAVSQAADAYDEFLQHFVKMRDQDSVIQALDKVYQTLRGHDEGVTREVMYRTVEGITKFFKKDWRSRLPIGFGTFHGLVGGKASYAQAALGREQMAWDELETYTFIHKARAANLITGEQMLKLEKDTGSRPIQLTGGIARTLIPILFAALAFYMMTKVSEEK